MEVINPQTIDMKTIKTNKDGDYVFDIKAADTQGQSYDGYIVIKYNEYTLDTLSEWYHLNWGVNKKSARKFLEDLHREGRDKLFEKCKINTDLNNFSLKAMTSDAPNTIIWELTIYKE